MRERWRRVSREEAGYSLIEMLVSMVVFGVAIAMVYTGVIVVSGKTRDVENSAEAASQLRQALAQIDRQVRSGNVLYAPGNEAVGASATTGCSTPTSPANLNAGTCMRVYTQADGLDRCVQWQLRTDPARPTTTELRTRDWDPAWQSLGSTAVSSWSVVARGLAPGQFPFVLQDGATAYRARLLDIRFEAIDPRRADRVVISSSLSGRNTNYGYDAGQCTPVPAA